MPNCVVCDCGPLIALAKLDQLALLPALFEVIHIPKIVLDEATDRHTSDDALAIEAFVQAHVRGQRRSKTIKLWPAKQEAPIQKLLAVLDEGEAQAIALAQELGCHLFIDERRGRAVAKAHGLQVVGVVGLLLDAKRKHKIMKIRPLLIQLDSVGYYIGNDLKAQVLKLAKEA